MKAAFLVLGIVFTIPVISNHNTFEVTDRALANIQIGTNSIDHTSFIKRKFVGKHFQSSTRTRKYDNYNLWILNQLYNKLRSYGIQNKQFKEHQR